MSQGQLAPDPLGALPERDRAGIEQHIQTAIGHHIAQADRGGIAIVGDGNVAGDGNVVKVTKQQAGDGAIQVGDARDVNIDKD